MLLVISLVFKPIMAYIGLDQLQPSDTRFIRFIIKINTDWVSGNEKMMTSDDNLQSTSTLLN